MVLKQFYLNCLAHASYLIGDETSQTAAVVDPQRDVDQYVAYADEHGLRIAHVFLTHFHADFIAGHLELRDRTGATIYLGAAAKAEYRFTPLADGDVVEFGKVRLTALETPGHTAESISIVVHDLERSATEPYAVLTGDTLFVGDVGRPDLRVALGWSAAKIGGRPAERHAQVRPADVTNKERVAGQDRIGLGGAALEVVDQDRDRFSRVAGRLERGQANLAEFDDIAVASGVNRYSAFAAAPR